MVNVSSGEKSEDTSLRLLIYCNEISTRYLFRVSLDRKRYVVDFAPGQSDFMNALVANGYDIFVVDASDGKGSVGRKLIGEIAGSRLKGLRRVVIISEKPMPAEANRMSPFGPTCFLEYYFSRSRLNDTLRRVMEIKDSGARVKSDSKFFDVSVFDGKKG